MKMIFKKSILLFSILLIFIVSIGSISASDMGNNADLDLADSPQTIDDQILTESPLADDGDEGGSDPQDPQAGEGEGNDDLGGDTPTVKSFEEIQNQIDAANENDVIELSGSYAGDSFITVNKSLTIKGTSEDTSLDLNDYGQYFYVDGVNVIFENLKFINTNSIAKDFRFVFNNSANCSFVNCSFTKAGGFWSDFGTISIENCSFVYGSRICSDFGTISIENSTFKNCSADISVNSQGPIFINNSIFENGYSEVWIYSNSSDCLISNSNFTACKMLYYLINCSNGNVINCSFKNMSLNMPLIYLISANAVKDSTFVNCIAHSLEYGDTGRVIWGIDVVENCIFINTTVAPKYTVTKTGSSYGNITLKIKLTDYYCDNIIPNQKFCIIAYDPVTTRELDGNVTVRTDQNGEVIFKVPYDVGQYRLTYVGYGPYVYGWPVSANFTFNVTKAATIVNATKLTTTYNSGKTFNIKVLNKNTKKAASGVKLSLKVYTGKKYKTYTVTTDKNGLAKFKASTLAIGSHKVVITGSNKNYVISKKESTIKINKAPTTVTAPKVTYKYKKSKYFKVTVINKATKKAVSSINVKIKVYTGKKYKTYTRKTNSKGLAKLNTKSLKKGTHKVVISSGNAKYTISKKSTIVIKK